MKKAEKQGRTKEQEQGEQEKVKKPEVKNKEQGERKVKSQKPSEESRVG